MKYSIYIKHIDGHGAYLSHRDRTAWTLRTARKHLTDVTREKLSQSDKWVNVEYFALVAA